MATGNIGEEEHNKDTTQYVLCTTRRKKNSNEHLNT
jgi:hypothetical protein